MTVKDLIKQLQQLPEDMPITINEYIDFTEMYSDTIKISQKEYWGFPFSENDHFNYISLEIRDKEYWNDNI